jgi:hypothetical protein
VRASFLPVTVAPLLLAAGEPVQTWMPDCQLDLLSEKNPSKPRVTLCGVRAEGRCRISSKVSLLGSVPQTSISSLALTLGAEIRFVRLIRFASGAAYVYYSQDFPNGSPIRLYVQEHGKWRLQYSCDLPVP